MSSHTLRTSVVIVLLSAGVVGTTAQVWGAPKPSTPTRTNQYVQITLKQQLEQGLKCRRPVEFEFVERVTKKVENGELSMKTVNIAFAWSRNRDNHRPFMYFERAVIELARRENVIIKPVPLVVITPTQ